MAITRTDVLDPEGELIPEMFPEYTEAELNAAVDAWIAQGESKYSGLSGEQADEAVLNWTYYRGFWKAYTRLSASASRVGVSNAVNYGFTVSQIDSFKERAVRYRDKAEQVANPTETAGSSTRPHSQIIDNQPGW